MAKKSKNRKPTPENQDNSSNNNDLWVNPRSNIRGPDGNRGWSMDGNITPNNGARFLELADLALGLKKPANDKKRATTANLHSQDKDKTEPYSQ